MYKHVLRAIDGIEIFPVISLVIFMVFFAGLVLYAFKLSKNIVNHMENLPLEDDTPSISNKMTI